MLQGFKICSWYFDYSNTSFTGAYKNLYKYDYGL